MIKGRIVGREKRSKPEGHKSRAVGSQKKCWEEAVSLLLAKPT